MKGKKQKEIFGLLSNSKLRGISGAIDIDSKITGPKVGILCMTHGNEPCGLSVAEYILNDMDLKKGSVRIILQNIKAGKNYFLSKKSNTNNRFVDINLNRLPALRKKDHKYEIKRARELKKLYKDCDVLIDLHSTSQKSKPMCISFDTTPKNMVQCVSVPTVIIGIEKIQKGKPVMFIAPNRTKKIAFECGSHTEKQSFGRAIKYTSEILSYLNMINKKPIKNKRQKHFFVKSSLILKNSFTLIKRFKNFEEIKKGQVVAENESGEVLVSRENLISLFCQKDFKNISPGDEALFLCTRG